MGACKAVISGTPERARISTSHTERQILTMRMQMRRFTRLTNAVSKKIENREAAIALHCMHYNFDRVHQTLRVTPAMEAGISTAIPQSFEELLITQGVWADSSFRQISFCLPRGVSVLS
jgi:hypothetical protein